MNNHFLFTLGALFLLQSVIIISKTSIKSDKIEKKKSLHWTTLTLLICQWLMIVTCLLDSLLYAKISDYSTLIGLTLILASVLITAKSFKALGDNYSMQIRVRKGHTLVNTGVYKYIRNPMDLAEIFFMIGLPLFSSSIVSLLFLIPFIPIMIIKINFEEALLSKELKGYKEYMKKTKKLFPFIY
ncbi:MAG: isoprenylcysteine carboxylmethyltransferase family protein [Candidatus Nanoarchaeia archaeon]|nr:isoprenylcysteine carboxylmethyltransferase family protein [Candidatus Nanoarchaeia archaeon]